MLVVNTIILWEKEKLYQRILWIDYKMNLVYLINLNENTMPICNSVDEIEYGLNNREICVVDDIFSCLIASDKELNQKSILIRDAAWSEISNIIRIEPEIYDKKTRRKIIERNCSDRFHINTINKYLQKFWRRGMCKNALLPDYNLCGARGVEKKDTNIKRGRKRKYTTIKGINIDEELKKKFKISINKYYYSISKKNLKLTYECMLKDYFTEKYIDESGNEVLRLNNEEVLPTFGQFKYWFYQSRDLRKEIINRKGYKKYLQTARPVIGNYKSEIDGPGDKFQIDATIADIYLVSKVDRNRIIGRPVIYSVIDVFSRMITGIYVGLEGPSWGGATNALINVATNKKEFCAEYDIDIDEIEWPTHYLPKVILADRGEFSGKCSEGIIDGLGISVELCPPYRSDFKGIIEQYFNTINNKIIKPFLPGAVNKDFERGDKDYRLDAKLNIKDFTKIIIRCVLHYNNSHVIKNYSLDQDMIEDNVIQIPLNLWKWGVINRSGKLRSISMDVVKYNLLIQDNATVTEKGIRFKGIYYYCKEALEEQWFIKARIRGRWKIEIRYDKRTLDNIYLKIDCKFITCKMMKNQKIFNDINIEELEYINYINKEKLEQTTYKELNDKTNLLNSINSILNESKEKSTEKTVKVSNRYKLKNIRHNRETEKILERNIDKSKDTIISELENYQQKEDKINKIDSSKHLEFRKVQMEKINEQFKKNRN